MADSYLTFAADYDWQFRREHLAIPLRRCLWAELPGTLAERFDNVLGGVHALVLEDGELIGHELTCDWRPGALW
jgi:hypothetical protein